MLKKAADVLASVSGAIYKFLHHNVPQLLVMMVMAHTTICIWGRGTGKTNGPTATRAYHNAVVMPRSVGAIGCMSYAHLIDVILPELIKKWESMGLIEGVHFWVRRFPPPELKVPKAYRPLQDATHAIFWCNGSAIKLFSVNFNALKNSDSVDWMIFEEGRYLKYNKVKEMFRCRRGNTEYFGHLPEHLSLMIVTDMPPDKESEWLFEYRKEMNDALIQYILELEQQVSLRYWELQRTTNKKKREALEHEMEKFRAEANRCRMDAVYVSYATTLDNIHVLGERTIRDWIRDSATQLDALIALLSRRPTKVPKCFYPWLDEDVHGVSAMDNAYISKLRVHEERNWRWQADYDLTQGLEIAGDYNAQFSCIVTAQMQDVGAEKENYHRLNNIYVEHPDTLTMLAHKWCDYHEGYPVKEVTYYYDHTTIGEDSEKRRAEGETFDKIVIEVLEKRGWDVNAVYVGHTWGHHTRYNEIANIHKATEDAPFTVTYNLGTCAELIEACQGAQVLTTAPNGGLPHHLPGLTLLPTHGRT